MNNILFCILYLYFGSFGMFTSSEVMLDRGCDSHDCSQSRRDHEGDQHFHCKIGMQNECDIAEQQSILLANLNNANVAKLNHIALYNRIYQPHGDVGFRALNFTMVMPHADKSLFDVKGILVNFHSPKAEFRDTFYHANSRCRLFDVTETKLTSVDLHYPRELGYPCFVGLSEDNAKTSYILNLTVLPYMTSTAYHLAAYANGDGCTSASAIAILLPDKIFHVVFDNDMNSSESYKLSLYKNDRLMETVDNKTNQHSFTPNGSGEYRVRIEPVPLSRKCRILFTDSIKFVETNRREDIDVAIIVGLGVSVEVVVVIVVAVVSVVLVIVVVVLCFKPPNCLVNKCRNGGGVLRQPKNALVVGMIDIGDYHYSVEAESMISGETEDGLTTIAYNI